MQIFEEQFITRPTSDGQVSWHPISSSPNDNDMSASSFDTTDLDNENASVQESTYTISSSGTFSWPSRDLISALATVPSIHNTRQLTHESTNGKLRKVLGDRTNNAPRQRTNQRNSSSNPHNSSFH
mmetsp:Transcript_22274/g.55008  ORF Transcript_22274/g.55008 Transcript_22274/m.55008 type:complete len:126 (-) Transcript_22274:2461-2838(-)